MSGPAICWNLLQLETHSKCVQASFKNFTGLENYMIKQLGCNLYTSQRISKLITSVMVLLLHVRTTYEEWERELKMSYTGLATARDNTNSDHYNSLVCTSCPWLEMYSTLIDLQRLASYRYYVAIFYDMHISRTPTGLY